jgi:hypothetical protein
MLRVYNIQIIQFAFVLLIIYNIKEFVYMQ